MSTEIGVDLSRLSASGLHRWLIRPSRSGIATGFLYIFDDVRKLPTMTYVSPVKIRGMHGAAGSSVTPKALVSVFPQVHPNSGFPPVRHESHPSPGAVERGVRHSGLERGSCNLPSSQP